MQENNCTEIVKEGRERRGVLFFCKINEWRESEVKTGRKNYKTEREGKNSVIRTRGESHVKKEKDWQDSERTPKREERGGLRNWDWLLFDVVKMTPSIPLILLVVIGELTSGGSAERMSGLYVDNGFDQTVVHRVISQREKREVEHEILNLLGLPDRPRTNFNWPTQVKRSAPKFLLDIYKNALGEDEEDKSATHHRRSSEFDLSRQDLKAIDQSDAIVTFAAHSK